MEDKGSRLIAGVGRAGGIRKTVDIRPIRAADFVAGDRFHLLPLSGGYDCLHQT